MAVGDAGAKKGSILPGDHRPQPQGKSPGRAEGTDPKDIVVEDGTKKPTDCSSSPIKSISGQSSRARNLLREIDRILMPPPKDRPPCPLRQVPLGSPRCYTVVQGRMPPVLPQASPYMEPLYSPRRYAEQSHLPVKKRLVCIGPNRPQPGMNFALRGMATRTAIKNCKPVKQHEPPPSTKQSDRVHPYDKEPERPLLGNTAKARLNPDSPTQQLRQTQGAALSAVQLLGLGKCENLMRQKEPNSGAQLLRHNPLGLPKSLLAAGRTRISPAFKMPPKKCASSRLAAVATGQEADMEKPENDDGDEVQRPASLGQVDHDEKK